MVAARAQYPANRHSVHLRGTWQSETLWLSAYAEAAITAATGCSAGQPNAAAAATASCPTAVAATDVSSWMVGVCRRAANSLGTVHATRRVYSLRGDGGGLFHTACAEGLLADSEHGRASGLPLLHLSLSGCGRRRRLELR